MDPASRLWKPRLLYFAVLVILGVIGVIQYQWFSQSAMVEIEGTVRALEAGVRQTVVREFQRYAPLASDLGSQAGSRLEEPQALDLVHRLWSAYGPQGAAPDLVAWVGWRRTGSPVVEKVTDRGLVSEPAPPGPRVPGGRERLGSVLLTVDGPEPGRFTLAVVRSAGTVYLGLDSDRFFDTYVRPALAEVYPGSTVTWERPLRMPAPGTPPLEGQFNTRTYSFNPLVALFAGSSVPRTLTVGVPRFFEPRTIATQGRAEPLLWADLPAPGFLLVKVVLPADAPVLGVERRLAWNWLGSTLLLVVLAVAFGLILRQSARLADLRRREREFVASVSHELRTPLTVIRSAADNVSRGIVPPERQGRYGELILDQTLRLGRMIEHMLTFAQTEAAPPAPTWAPMVFGPWLADLRPGLDALAAGRSVTLVWDVAGVPPEGFTDPEALRLILENLVVNSINHAYGPGGGSRVVRITLRHLVPDRLELTVDDDGRGISPKEAKKVFEPFYRDQVSRNAQEKGSGLGLFLARRQARRLRGDLTLESPWRRLDDTRKPGCRFILTVPFRTGTEAPYGR